MKNKMESCGYCGSLFKNKHNLKSHLIRSKKCLKQRGLQLETTFICSCEMKFVSNIGLNEHKENCKHFAVYVVKNEYEEKIAKLQKEMNDTIYELKETHLKETQMLEKEKLFLEKQLDRVHNSFESVAKEAVNRPTTTNNINIRNILSSDKTVDSLDTDDLMTVFRKHLTEEVLLGGQRSIAKLCSENIIQINDKMLLICTDTSRDKYKYMDKSGNVKEDFYARNFTNKIIKPLEVVGQDVYENSRAEIADQIDQLSCIDYGKKASLRNKEERLSHSLFELKSIDVENHNSKFLNELSILTKR